MINLADILLSLRYYFYATPVRDASALPALYPTMREDKAQGGIRIGDLFLEERIPSFPAIGIRLEGISDHALGYGFRMDRMPVFLDAACKVLDPKGGMDRIKSVEQRLSLMSDLYALLTEKTAGGIPFYEWDGSNKAEIGRIRVERSPRPRVMASPVGGDDVLGIACDFRIATIDLV